MNELIDYLKNNLYLSPESIKVLTGKLSFGSFSPEINTIIQNSRKTGNDRFSQIMKFSGVKERTKQYMEYGSSSSSDVPKIKPKKEKRTISSNNPLFSNFLSLFVDVNMYKIVEYGSDSKIDILYFWTVSVDLNITANYKKCVIISVFDSKYNDIIISAKYFDMNVTPVRKLDIIASIFNNYSIERDQVTEFDGIFALEKKISIPKTIENRIRYLKELMLDGEGTFGVLELTSTSKVIRIIEVNRYLGSLLQIWKKSKEQTLIKWLELEPEILI